MRKNPCSKRRGEVVWSEHDIKMHSRGRLRSTFLRKQKSGKPESLPRFMKRDVACSLACYASTFCVSFPPNYCFLAAPFFLAVPVLGAPVFGAALAGAFLVPGAPRGLIRLRASSALNGN